MHGVVQPQRIRFFTPFGLKLGRDFYRVGLKSGKVLNFQ